MQPCNVSVIMTYSFEINEALVLQTPSTDARPPPCLSPAHGLAPRLSWWVWKQLCYICSLLSKYLYFLLSYLNEKMKIRTIILRRWLNSAFVLRRALDAGRSAWAPRRRPPRGEARGTGRAASAARCTAWSSATSGARSASGKRPAVASGSEPPRDVYRMSVCLAV